MRCGQAARALGRGRFWYHLRPNNRPDRGPTLASRSELSAFLEGVERRAFKQAMFAVRDEERGRLVTIGKAWEMAQPSRRRKQDSPYDLVIVDAPASGHGIGMLARADEDGK